MPLGKIGVLGPIYELVGEGFSDRDIANMLTLTEVTVHGGVSRLLHSFKRHDWAELVLYASPTQKETLKLRTKIRKEVMTSLTGSQPMQTARLDRTLEYAVIQSWDELMPESTSGVVHIEYQTGADGALEFFKIWASTNWGYWNLICEYWMRPLWSYPTGVTFGKGYDSVGFARTLELVMGHENAFVKLTRKQGVIQIFAPTQEKRAAAERWMSVAFNHDRPEPMQQLVAA